MSSVQSLPAELRLAVVEAWSLRPSMPFEAVASPCSLVRREHDSGIPDYRGEGAPVRTP